MRLHALLYLVVGEVDTLMDERLPVLIVCCVVQVFRLESSRIDHAVARVISIDDVLLNQLHTTPSSERIGSCTLRSRSSVSLVNKGTPVANGGAFGDLAGCHNFGQRGGPPKRELLRNEPGDSNVDRFSCPSFGWSLRRVCTTVPGCR